MIASDLRMKSVVMFVLLQEDVTAGLRSYGRHDANHRLLRRLNGKVELEELIAALKRIGNNELAKKIEGMI